jgi:anaerobic selenocysteine-containing dehydrogenase
MEITRREAIKLGVAAGVLGGVSGVLLKAAAESPETKSESALSVVSVPSICGMCMAQCAIWIDVVNGKPVRLAPTPTPPPAP